MAAFPWAEVMSFGLGRLGWSPEQLWNATPREIGAALAAHGPVRSVATEREVLLRLMAAHPDARDRNPSGDAHDGR